MRGAFGVDFSLGEHSIGERKIRQIYDILNIMPEFAGFLVSFRPNTGILMAFNALPIAC